MLPVRALCAHYRSVVLVYIDECVQCSHQFDNNERRQRATVDSENEEPNEIRTMNFMHRLHCVSLHAFVFVSSVLIKKEEIYAAAAAAKDETKQNRSKRRKCVNAISR